MKQKKIDWRIVIAGIVGLTAIEITALCNGINGIVLSTIIGIIALTIGIILPNPIK
jgi:hypothetical protein